MPSPSGTTPGATRPHGSDDALPSERLRSALLFLGIVLLIAIDLVEDWRSGSPRLHFELEAIVLVLAAVGLWLLRSRVLRERARARELRARLAELLGDLGPTAERVAEGNRAPDPPVPSGDQPRGPPDAG